MEPEPPSSETDLPREVTPLGRGDTETPEDTNPAKKKRGKRSHIYTPRNYTPIEEVKVLAQPLAQIKGGQVKSVIVAIENFRFQVSLLHGKNYEELGFVSLDMIPLDVTSLDTRKKQYTRKPDAPTIHLRWNEGERGEQIFIEKPTFPADERLRSLVISVCMEILSLLREGELPENQGTEE